MKLREILYYIGADEYFYVNKNNASFGPFRKDDMTGLWASFLDETLFRVTLHHSSPTMAELMFALLA